MAKPRVFISSTYYDLKHIRATLENFVEELGYEPILSEKGDIAYTPDVALDESCYREVRNSDIFVLIIGGRYGSEKSEKKSKLPKEFYDRYDSITRQEYASAVEKDIPIYILIEKSVYADFETYLRNKLNIKIEYAHVDSVNIFHLLEQILAQPRNNPIFHFDRYSEIEGWLKEQWAGLFRELLSRMTNQQQLSSLTAQVRELGEVNKTLKTYLEEVVSKIAPDESVKLIKAESNRLLEARKSMLMETNALIRHLRNGDIPQEDLSSTFMSAANLESFVELLKKKHGDNKRLMELLLRYKKPAEHDFNELKLLMTVPDEALPALLSHQNKKRHLSPRRGATRKKLISKG